MSDLKLARRVAMDYLARREHTQVELKQKLQRREFGESIIEQVVTKLEQEGLQSDGRFVEAYIAMRARKGLGPLRIEQELQGKQLSTELISQYLEQESEHWFARMQQVWQKRFTNPPKTYPEKAKQIRFLQYRGFPLEQIHELFADLP